MITIRPLEQLGREDMDWLSARFHFSFANYFDPARMGFGPLRVWNDDLFGAGGGFPMHPHREMEIVTYIREGAITHQDSLGNKGRTGPGDVQVMSAGTGIVHSEFNHEDTDLRLFQIWVHPNVAGVPPRWETTTSDRSLRRNKPVALASGQGHDGALKIHQDAAFFAVDLDPRAEVTHDIAPGRRVYLVPARGEITVNGTLVPTRAGAEIDGETEIRIKAGDQEAEVVFYDLP